VFKEFKNLRRLHLRDSPQVTLFLEGDGGVVHHRSSFVYVLACDSKSLEVIQLGNFVYRQPDGWLRKG
jgi:hypothetical protein